MSTPSFTDIDPEAICSGTTHHQWEPLGEGVYLCSLCEATGRLEVAAKRIRIDTTVVHVEPGAPLPAGTYAVRPCGEGCEMYVRMDELLPELPEISITLPAKAPLGPVIRRNPDPEAPAPERLRGGGVRDLSKTAGFHASAPRNDKAQIPVPLAGSEVRIKAPGEWQHRRGVLVERVHGQTWGVVLLDTAGTLDFAESEFTVLSNHPLGKPEGAL